MDTFLFIDEDCFLNVAMEASAMRAALLFTDTVTSNGVLANALQMYNGVEKAGDDEILAWVIATKESLPDGEDLVNNYYQIYNYEKKVRAQKHKSKDDLIFLNKLVSSKAHMRDYVKLDMKCKLEEQRAVHLSRFE